MVGRISGLLYWRILFILSMAGLLGASIWYGIERARLVPKYTTHLINLAEQRSEALQKQVQKQETLLQDFIGKPDTIASLTELLASGDQKVKDATAKIENLLHSYRFILSYKNFLVINLEGKVVFSDVIAYRSVNVLDSAYKDAALAHSFIRVSMSLTPDIAEYSYDALLQEPALFVCAPFFEKERLIGVVVMRIDETSLNNIMYDYLGLGTMGETVLSKTLENGIIFLSNARNDVTTRFKKYIPFERTARTGSVPPIQSSALGGSGAGVILDYAQVNTVSAWRFVPKLNWGLVSKIPLAEIEKELMVPLRLMYAALLCFIIVSLLILLEDSPVHRAIVRWRGKVYSALFDAYAYTTLLLFFVLVLVICCGVGYAFKRTTDQTLLKTQQTIHAHLDIAREQMDTVLERVLLATYSLTYDLGFRRLKAEEIPVRLERELRQNPHIVGISIAYAPYKYKQDQKLFAPFMYRQKDGSLKTIYLNELYDYTQATDRDVVYRTFYLATLETKDALWLSPRIDEITDRFVFPVSLQFYPHNNEQYGVEGVVTVLLDMNSINQLVESISVSATGYSYLLSSNGTFLYHPQYPYMKEQITLADMGRRKASPELVALQEKAIKGESGFYTFFDAETNEKKAIYFIPIPKNRWSLGVIFPEREGENSPVTVRRFQMWLLLLITVVCMVGFALLVNITKPERRTAWSFFIITTLPLCACFALLIAIVNQGYLFDEGRNVLMRDRVGLKHFLLEQEALATIIHDQPPIELPTGLDLRAIELKGLNVAISGYIWQKYDKKKHAGIEPAILFPQAINPPSLIKLHEEDVGEETSISWQFSVLLAQELNYAHYPFDTKRLSIILKHPDMMKNILLIPDFQDYQNITPSALPGIHAELTVPGFTLVKSIFAYDQLPLKTNLGVHSYDTTNLNTRLSYEVVCKRGMLNALIEFLLPVFIILFAIYVIFCLGEAISSINEMYISTAYTGMLLSMIFLHRSLRERYSTGGALYIEFFFFLAYITIFILVFHTMLKSQNVGTHPWYKATFRLYRHYFWQLQLVLSILVTMITFY